LSSTPPASDHGHAPEAAPEAEAEAEAEFQKVVRASLRRNYTAHLAHGLLGQTGMRLVNAPTFLPAYISLLTGSDTAVGIARGLQYLGMFLSPILGATWIEHRRRVIPSAMIVGALMRVAILGLALGGLFLSGSGPLFAAWLALGSFGLFLGVQGVVFNVLVAKVIPVELRGRLMGLRNALAGVTATAVAFVAGRYLIDDDALGNGYAATFLLAFVLTSVGLLMMLFVREPDSPVVRAPSRLGARLRELPALLRSDRGFTRYFLARALATMGRMAVPFYVLFAATQIEIGGQQLGELSAAFIGAQSAGNLAWGVAADRVGFRAIFIASLGLWILAVLVLMQAASLAWLLAVFAALGAGLGGFQMSAQSLVLEFGSRQNLPMRIAVANSASELVAAIGAVAGGAIGAVLGYTTLFWIAVAFQLAGLAIVVFFVDEPRGRRRAPSHGKTTAVS
jgi:MFS family permease